MPHCKVIRKPKRRVCIGDLKDRLTIQLRSIQPPEKGAVDFDEKFETKRNVWGSVRTLKGEVFFDGTSQERLITHDISVRYIEGVTQEDWVFFNEQRFDVLSVENLDERNEFMTLRCTNRGLSTAQAAKI